MEKLPTWSGCGASYRVLAIDHSTVANKAKNVPYEVIKRFFSKCNRQTHRSLRFPKYFVVVASTTMTVRQTRFPGKLATENARV